MLVFVAAPLLSAIALKFGPTEYFYDLADIVRNLERHDTQGSVVQSKIGRVWPSLSDIRHCIPAILRGTSLGSVLGVPPGGGAFYTFEKKVAKKPRHFGEGDIRGVAAPNPPTTRARRRHLFRC